MNHVSSETDIRLISIAGGTKNNVISSECKAEILVAKEDADKVKASVAELKATWDKEFLGKEPGLTVDVEEESVSGVAVMNAESTKRVITYFVICPNGVQCYDRELEGLVETSLNLGIVETTKDAVKLESLVRSSMESKKADMKEILDTCAQAVGANGKVQGWISCMGVQSRFRTSQSNGRDIRRAVWKRTGCIYHSRRTGVWTFPWKETRFGLCIYGTGSFGYSFL